MGDGMGFEQVKAGGMYVHGAPGTLPFEVFPYRAEMTTHSADSPGTDSAAAATALATGRKVNNGVVSVADPGGPPGRRSWASPTSASSSSTATSRC